MLNCREDQTKNVSATNARSYPAVKSGHAGGTAAGCVLGIQQTIRNLQSAREKALVFARGLEKSGFAYCRRAARSRTKRRPLSCDSGLEEIIPAVTSLTARGAPPPLARLGSLRSLAAAAGALSHSARGRRRAHRARRLVREATQGNCVTPSDCQVQKKGPLVTAALEE
jgi:hypothetical protein